MKQRSRFILMALFAMALSIAFAAEKKAESKAGAAKPYTLKTCPVSDEKLGEMGEPYVFTHAGREIKLCCKPCQKDFKKDPEKYLKKIEAAEKKAAKSK